MPIQTTPPIEQHSILIKTRSAVGLDESDESFDTELILHINGALLVLHQNGVGSNAQILDQTAVWQNFKDENQVEGNKYFGLVPMYVYTKTKILFDPPPPSNVAYYDAYVSELLWRLKLAYDTEIPRQIVVPEAIL